jgi:hypothetical protein
LAAKQLSVFSAQGSERKEARSRFLTTDNCRLITDPEPWHADALLALMAPKDVAAFAALGVGDPGSVIKAGIRASTYAWCALDGCEPLCIGGVVPDSTLLGDVGRPWQVSQPGLERHKKRFLRESRAQLAILRRHYPALSNYVSCDYPKSLRWLGWLGFEIGDEVLLGGAAVRRILLS